MNSWRETTMGELLKIDHGFAFKGEHFSETGDYVVLTPGNFHETGGFRPRPEKDRYYQGKFPDRYRLNQSDLIVAMTEQGEGLLGSSAFIPESNKYLHNQRLGLVRAKRDAADETFLYYLFNADYVRQQIRNSSSGAKVRHTSPERIYRVKVLAPAKRCQQKIAAILSAYDELIENNKRRIVLLEKMAEEIYREWFVRLRFPGHEKVKNVKGVPEGWRIEPMGSLLSEIIDYRGLTPAKLNSNWEDTGIIALSALNVKNGRLIRLEDTGKVSDTLYERWMRKKLQQFDILLTSEAPLGQVYMLMESEKYVLSQRLFGLRANPKRIAPCYLYHYLLFPIGQHQLTSRATGSTVGGIRQQLLRKVEVMLPTDKLLEAYTRIVLPILENIDRLSKQNSVLIKSRDMLLPRLISGKLSVENLDIQFPPSMVEEVKTVPSILV